MTDGSLTPATALAYLRELSLDVRAAVVLGPTGEVRAGDAALAGRAGEALRETAPGAARSVRAGEEELLVARGADGTAIAVSAGPRALRPLLFHDIRAILDDLAVASPATPRTV